MRIFPPIGEKHLAKWKSFISCASPPTYGPTVGLDLWGLQNRDKPRDFARKSARTLSSTAGGNHSQRRRSKFQGPPQHLVLAVTQVAVEEIVKEKIKIRLEAYDHRILDKAAQDIADTAKRTGAKVAGPIPLPTHIERFTVQRSPHVDKKSREQFELRTHARVIEILEPTAKTNDVFSKVDVPAGVDITIKQTVR